METIVNTFLLYVDTQRSQNADSTGTNAHIPLNQSGIVAGDNQFIRLTLNNFSMFRNYPTVNVNNGRFVTRNNVTAEANLNLTYQNYASLFDLATNFADKVKAQLVADAIAGGSTATLAQSTITSITPATTTSMAGTTDNVIGFTLNFKTAAGAAVAHGLTDVKLQMYTSQADAFALLGGDRINDDADNTTNSITITNNTNDIVFLCKYPAQLFTNDYVYLRTDLQNTNVETPSFTAKNTDAGPGRVGSSRILARIPAYNQFNYYVAGMEKEYFLNIMQRHVPYMNLFVTDKNNRTLPTGGAGTSQNTLGNLSFSCVIRCDIIERAGALNTLSTPAIPNPTAKRFSGPLTNFEYGADGYSQN